MSLILDWEHVCWLFFSTELLRSINMISVMMKRKNDTAYDVVRHIKNSRVIIQKLKRAGVVKTCGIRYRRAMN